MGMFDIGEWLSSFMGGKTKDPDQAAADFPLLGSFFEDPREQAAHFASEQWGEHYGDFRENLPYMEEQRRLQALEAYRPYDDALVNVYGEHNVGRPDYKEMSAALDQPFTHPNTSRQGERGAADHRLYQWNKESHARHDRAKRQQDRERERNFDYEYGVPDVDSGSGSGSEGNSGPSDAELQATLQALRNRR